MLASCSSHAPAASASMIHRVNPGVPAQVDFPLAMGADAHVSVEKSSLRSQPPVKTRSLLHSDSIRLP